MKETTIQDFSNYIIREDGLITNTNTGKSIKVFNHKRGYPTVNLIKQNKVITKMIHRLLAIHFIENPFNLGTINHIDGDKKNYKLENLEWCTQSENMMHAYRNGLMVNSETQRQSARLSGLLNSHPIINMETGIYYDSIKEASFSCGLSPSGLAKKLQGKLINKTQFKKV